jgi:hypothetical protein
MSTYSWVSAAATVSRPTGAGRRTGLAPCRHLLVQADGRRGNRPAERREQALDELAAAPARQGRDVDLERQGRCRQLGRVSQRPVIAVRKTLPSATTSIDDAA